MAKPLPRTKRVLIGKDRWTIRRQAVPRDRWGDCDRDRRLIRVDGRLRGINLLNVLLHELIHARWWPLSEDEVTEFSEEAAGILYAFGFRDEEDADG
jgi:hypothetical protein